VVIFLPFLAFEPDRVISLSSSNINKQEDFRVAPLGEYRYTKKDTLIVDVAAVGDGPWCSWNRSINTDVAVIDGGTRKQITVVYTPFHGKIQIGFLERQFDPVAPLSFSCLTHTLSPMSLPHF
jgi:hypothetical protein